MKKTAIVTLLCLAVLCVGMAFSNTKTVRDCMGDSVGGLTLNENLTWSGGGLSGTWCYGDDINVLYFKTDLPGGGFELWIATRIPGTWFYEMSGNHPFYSPAGGPYSFDMLD